MPRRPLPDDVQAYNALVDIVSDRDAKIAGLVADRNRAVDAAECLYPSGYFRRVEIAAVRPKRRRR